MKWAMYISALAIFFLPSVALALENGEIRITKEGKVSINNAYVFQVAGTNFYTRVYWRDVFLRVTIVTSSKTKVNKKHGEVSTVEDIKEGDYLDVEGEFPGSTDSFIISAASIVDNALEKESLTVKGTITGTSPDSDEFKMKTSRGTIISVTVSGATMKKGIIPITVSGMKIGDTVTSVSGTYDYANKVLSASNVQIYQTPSAFVPHNFQGKIKSISGTGLPAQIVVGLTKKDYTVNISANTKLLNKAGATIILPRFLVGDTVRFYGAVREDNLDQVDNVEIFRDLSL